MKKIYTKPYIAAESFQLDAAIANSCSSEGKQTLGFGMDSCTLTDDIGSQGLGALGYFGIACGKEGGHDVVNYKGDLNDGNDGVCYHGPQYSAMFMNS